MLNLGDNTNAVKLLWTGGWDSTFWLIYSLLIKNYIVQPYYIIDPLRKSSLLEIQRINEIREMITRRLPKINELLLHTKYYCLTDIKPNAIITKQVNSLRRKVYFGGQVRRITDYVASTEVATIDAAWTTNPTANTSTVEIISPLPNRYLDLIVMMAARSIRLAHDDPIQELDYIIEKESKAMKLRIARQQMSGPEMVRNVPR